MKTRILILATALSVVLTGCNKDDENSGSATPMTAQEVSANAQMDNIADDVSYIAETQSNETEAGRSANAQSFLSACTADVSTVQNGNIWTRTIDFGTTNCQIFSGHNVRGKIIVTFTNDFDAATRTISYAFENFYHDDRHVEGNRTVVKTMVNGHPQATISLDMTVTTPQGAVYHRTGQRVRDFVEGYNTPFNLSDNVFSITGGWVTTFPSGATTTALITAPVIVKWNCMHIVSGTISFTRNSNIAVLDYGNGDCDDDATITINGVVHNINLGF